MRGTVQLYRTDDNGTLNFTQLGSASADVGVAPAVGIAGCESPVLLQRCADAQLHR